MKILLDTHAFLWWDSNPEKLGATAAELLSQTENAVYVSVVSAWEIQIKKQLGKLSLSVPFAELMESQQQVNEINLLPVQLNHVLMLDDLPPFHKDPFDHLLIAQAKVEGLEIVTADPVFQQYGVRTSW